MEYGAGEGNRTLVFSMGGYCSAIELHPQQVWNSTIKACRRSSGGIAGRCRSVAEAHVAEHPEGADENQNGACGHEHEGGRHVLDVDHDVAGDGHDGKSHRRADRDLAGAERGAFTMERISM